ncbi:MAG: serine/threonine-protein kinase [Planctomycetota bacterium]
MPDGDPSLDLPDDLADRAAEQLMGVAGPERASVLAALVAAFPKHADGLHRLQAELLGAARLLAGTYPGTPAETATHIGGHRIIRRLGEGAFGIVFLCAQERPVVRHVAIKVLRPGAGDEKTLRRFGAERQLLASLNHPSITQVFDAGELPDGRPFFVMEYVDGPTLRRYCEERALPCRDRLQLFVALCRGVAHAHARGIVHRDLKPGNVLVVDTETGPLPKIIDFGIAKALFASEGGEGPRTDAGRVIGTPGYMSPEQASGRIHEVDGRADVFALGVMLYELLTWQLPWAHGAAATDTEPVRPSAKITSSTTAGTGSPPTQRRQLIAELRGDLDWITLKALARERDDRYPTPVALAEDLERHLRGEPVSVGPPSVTYRLRKYVRRNRALVGSLGGAAVLLFAGLLIALSYGKAAQAEVEDAKTAAAASFADATAAANRLVASANDVHLREAPQGDVARKAVLEAAQALFDRLLRDEPSDTKVRAGRCDALLSISQVHWLLGDTVRAGRAADEAYAEAEVLVAAAPESTVLRGLLGNALRAQGSALSLARNNEQAHPKFVAAAAHLAACAAEAPAKYARSHLAALRNAAVTLDPYKVKEAVAGQRQCLQLLAGLRADHPELAELTDDYVRGCLGLAAQLIRLRELDEADEILGKAVVELPLVTADRGCLTTELHDLQGNVAWQRKDRPAAIERYQATVAAASAWHLEQPQRLLAQEALAGALSSLAAVQGYSGNFEEASALYRRSIAITETMVQQFAGNPRPAVALGAKLVHFAQVLLDRARRIDLDEAAANVARAIAIDETTPPDAVTSRSARWRLLALQATIADARGDAEAAGFWQQVQAVLPLDQRAQFGVEQDCLVEAQTGLARAHFLAGRNDAAATWLAEARQRIEANKPTSDKRMVEVGWLEARVAAQRGDHVEIAAIADRIRAARNTWFGTRRVGDCLHLAWRCAVAAGDDAASEYAERATECYGRVMRTLAEDVAKDPNDPWFVLPWASSCVRAAELAAASGNAAKARELLDEALPILEGVRAASQSDLWDEDVVRDGLALQAKLGSATSGR